MCHTVPGWHTSDLAFPDSYTNHQGSSDDWLLRKSNRDVPRRVFIFGGDFSGWPGSGRNLSRPTGLATLIKHCTKFSPGDPLLRTFHPQSMNPDDSYVSLMSTSLPVVLATSIRAARWVICSGRHSMPHRPRVAIFYPWAVALFGIYSVVTPPHAVPGWHVLLSMWSRRTTSIWVALL